VALEQAQRAQHREHVLRVGAVVRREHGADFGEGARVNAERRERGPRDRREGHERSRPSDAPGGLLQQALLPSGTDRAPRPLDRAGQRGEVAEDQRHHRDAPQAFHLGVDRRLLAGGVALGKLGQEHRKSAPGYYRNRGTRGDETCAAGATIIGP
jgi:hypothetical protein